MRQWDVHRLGKLSSSRGDIDHVLRPHRRTSSEFRPDEIGSLERGFLVENFGLSRNLDEPGESSILLRSALKDKVRMLRTVVFNSAQRLSTVLHCFSLQKGLVLQLLVPTKFTYRNTSSHYAFMAGRTFYRLLNSHQILSTHPAMLF